MRELSLTQKEWAIVDKQCQSCKFWTDEGCVFTSDPYPVDECDVRVIEVGKEQ